MRIIGGELRSRRLQAVPGSATRPTSDRLRETLFNVLGDQVAGCHFADLYAGTGAVGIEALSRGASSVCFVERAAPALTTLRANLRSLGLERRAVVDQGTVVAALERRARQASADPFAILFLDPPYEAEADYTRVLGLLGGPAGERLLAPGALVVAEHASRSPLPERAGLLECHRVLKQGDASLSFYQRARTIGETLHPDAIPSADPA